MKRLAEMIGPLSELPAEVLPVAQRIVERYEAELEQITAHLSLIYEELMLLYDMGGEIASTLDATDIADRAVERLRELIEADRGFVALVGDDALQLIGSQKVPRKLLPLVEWATRQAVERDQPLIINDFGESDAPKGHGRRDLVGAPLRARGRVTGAVLVVDRAGKHGFSTEDQALVETIASQIGVAIDNSRLFRRTQEHAEELAKALDELGSTYDATLAALSGALDLRDNETEGHARRVTRYTVRVARELGLDGKPLIDIERGALMHDIGKIGVPDSILLKPDRLTEEEWAVMRTHPQLGHQMIRNIRFLSGAAPIVLHHHERFDGKGYPGGLFETTIPLGARIFAVADTFDAMTSDRPYRKALPYSAAREEVERCAGSQFDPDVVSAFCQVSADEWVEIRDDVERQLAIKRKDEPLGRHRS